jgi:hypothetical protein
MAQTRRTQDATLREVSEELAAFAHYSRSVVHDAVGLTRLTWQERAEWAERLAGDVLAALDAMPGPTCSNCAGDGMVWTHEGNVPCPACDGYGTTKARSGNG